MAADGSVIIKITGDDEGFKKKLDGLSGVAKKSFRALKVAASVAGGAMAAAGTYAIKVGSSFELSMSGVAATMQLSRDEIKNCTGSYKILHDAAIKAGSSTKYSATEAADALNYLALAGYDAQKAASVLPSVLNLAAAADMDLAAASDLATDAMAALNIEASKENLTAFGDQLAQTAAKSNTSVSQLGEAILTVGATANNLAGGTTELNTALGVLANRGTKGAEAGTSLRNIILSLTAPTDKAAAAMHDLGIQVADADGKMRPINDVMNDISAGLDGMSDTQKTQWLNSVFNKTDLADVQNLLAGCAGEYGGLYKAIEQSGGAMENMATTKSDNLKGAMDGLKSRAEALGIAFYESVNNPLTDMVKRASDSVGRLNAAFNTGGLRGMIAEIGKMSVEAARGVMGGIDSIAANIATRMPELLAQALPMVVGFSAKLRDGAGQLVDSGMNLIRQIAQGIANSLPVLIENVPTIVTNIAGIINDNAPKLLTTGLDIIITLGQGIIQSIPTLVANIPQIFEAILSVFSAINWIQLGQMIVNGIKAGAAALGGALKNAGQSAINAFKSINWHAVGTAVCNFIHNAISGAASLIGSALRSVGTNGMNAFRSINWASVGKAAINFIKSAIGGAAGLIVSALKSVGSRGMQAFTSINWASVGKNIISGIIRGISGAAASLFSSLKNLASRALGAAKSALGIKSPSRKFRDMVGKFIPMGIGAGVERYSVYATDAVEKMSDKLTDAARISMLQPKLKMAVDAQSARMTATLRGSRGSPVLSTHGGNAKTVYIEYAPVQKFDEPITLRQREEMNRRDARRLERMVTDA